MCVETSARIDDGTHKKYIEVKAHLTHTCPQFPVPVTQPSNTHPQITSPRSQQVRRSLSCPKTHKFSTFVPFSSIASSYHPTLSISSSHISFYRPLLLLQL